MQKQKQSPGGWRGWGQRSPEDNSLAARWPIMLPVKPSICENYEEGQKICFACRDLCFRAALLMSPRGFKWWAVWLRRPHCARTEEEKKKSPKIQLKPLVLCVSASQLWATRHSSKCIGICRSPTPDRLFAGSSRSPECTLWIRMCHSFVVLLFFGRVFQFALAKGAIHRGLCAQNCWRSVSVFTEVAKLMLWLSN